MAGRKVNARAFVDATLKTTAVLTFTDLESGESVTDDFTVVYYALSPKKARELDDWVEEFDRKSAALDERRAAHETAEAQRRLKAEADEEPFTPQPFTDPETESLQYGLAKLVAQMIHSLPDILDDDERPLAITAETLSTFASQNLRSIRDAVAKHTATDPTKPVSSPST